MAHARPSHARLLGCALGGASVSQILTFLKREGVENTEVYGGVDNFQPLGIFGLQRALCLSLRSLWSCYKPPSLLAFTGEKDEDLEVLAVVMSLCCNSPQDRTGRACVCPLNSCVLALGPLLVPRHPGGW